MDGKDRCQWASDDPIYQNYHDTEWGLPVFDDQKLFEMLMLEGAQAGLSWITILKRRENYRKAFDNFHAEKIIKYDEKKITELLNNEGIIRNKLKIHAVVTNAHIFLDIQKEFGSFSVYIWNFVGGTPLQNKWKTFAEVPVTTPESDAMSKDLKKRGIKFVGSTICYAFMQAIGMVNDHTTDCFCHKEITKM
jgi:DNA-3-methyladenine glycosylase I